MRVSWVRLWLCVAVAAVAVACSSPPPTSSTASTEGQELAVLGALTARMAPDGVAIEVGQPDAPTTVTVYEDFQCPYCARFEQVNGPELAARAAAGDIKVHYIFASLLDHKLGGHSSARAANAARAAVDAGGFPLYHHLLFDQQPQEGTDGFGLEVLVRIAASVPALNTAEWSGAVGVQAHQEWVDASHAAYQASQEQYPDGVPTVLIGAVDANPVLYDRAGFSALLDRAP
ncbi:DsbA family protein [Rhodococcus cerastii]|nr:DsbA family protein [Rhodococcus cerastii]